MGKGQSKSYDISKYMYASCLTGSKKKSHDVVEFNKKVLGTTVV